MLLIALKTLFLAVIVGSVIGFRIHAVKPVLRGTPSSSCSKINIGSFYCRNGATRLYDEPPLNNFIVEGLQSLPKSADGGSEFGPLVGLARYFSGSLNTANDIQNLAIILAGIAYLTYERRPRGSAKIDLIDIRRSTIKNANVGVFATKFIPKGTVIGEYPGKLLRLEFLKEKKIDEDAVKRAEQYLWQVSEDLYLDPTNSEGNLELEIPYFFGLYKVNTILARINEPPVNGDINIVSEVAGSGVSFIAERDIVTNEELFVDYGSKYNRDEYFDEQEKSRKQDELREFEESRVFQEKRFRPIVDEGDIPPEVDTSLQGGFIDSLKKKDDNYKRMGIIDAEEAVETFSEFGSENYVSPEDRTLIESLTGKKYESQSPSESESREVDLNAKEDTVSEADIAGILLGDAPPSESASLFGGLTATKSSDESPRSSTTPTTVISAEEAVKLQSMIDSMSEDEVKVVLKNLKQTLSDAVAMSVQERMKKSKGFAPKKLPKTPPIDSKIRKEYDEEFKQIEAELEKIFEDPMTAWDEMASNPEKYLDEKTLKELNKLIDKME